MSDEYDNYDEEVDVEEEAGSDFSGDDDEKRTGIFIDEEENQDAEDADHDTVEHQADVQLSHKPVKISFIESINRMSKNFMTKYEYTFAIAYRAQQIENGLSPHPEVLKLKHLTQALDIAKYELDHYQSDFPNFILRPILDAPKRKIYEKWLIPELIIPRDLLCIVPPQSSSHIKLNSNCGNKKRIEFDDKALTFATLKHYT